MARALQVVSETGCDMFPEDLKIIDFLLMLLMVGFIQFTLTWVFDRGLAKYRQRKENRECDFYVNGVHHHTVTVAVARVMAEQTPYEFMRSHGLQKDKKTKRLQYIVLVDTF